MRGGREDELVVQTSQENQWRIALVPVEVDKQELIQYIQI